ncbi:MAG: GDP-mannose 4,6-dehydratase, partial [Chitinophagaceae bacterium]|nr:GDP-mannose 4,6-dehydratase [Chitinophagaceae bacterium]
LDKLTYAGNAKTLQDIENGQLHVCKGRYHRFAPVACKLFKEPKFTAFLACAAKPAKQSPGSLVADTSSPHPTASLQGRRQRSTGRLFRKQIFYHISTDEVWLHRRNRVFTEETACNPAVRTQHQKPLIRSYCAGLYHTYKMPVKISNCSNTYGPFHFPEKLIRLCIHNIINNKPLPIVARVRDDYCRRSWQNQSVLFHTGRIRRNL